MYLTSNNWVSYVPLVLALFINLMILLNWRGLRTITALIVAMVGFTLIILTHQLILSSDLYNLGVALLLMGIWLNGSFISVLNKIRRILNPDILN